MRKLYTLIIISLFAFRLAAQPTYTSANWPAVGTVINSFDLDTAASEGPSGANQTWNFAGLTGSATPSVSQVVDPTSTPYTSSFPSATSAAVSPSLSGASVGYAYYTVGSSQIDLIGFVSDDGAGMVISFNYTSPRRVANFPLTYGSIFNGGYSAIASYTVSGMPYTDYRYGVATVQADAWGTVSTPGGTFNNSLRIKNIETTNDSIVFLGQSFVTSTDVTSYSWSDPNVLQSRMTISYVTSTAGTTKSVMYTDLGTGVNNNQSLKPLEIYPNPAVNSSVIHLNADQLKSGSATFIVNDINGKEVKNLEFAIREANVMTIDVDMSDCPAGIYMVRLQQKNNLYTSKFVKQ